VNFGLKLNPALALLLVVEATTASCNFEAAPSDIDLDSDFFRMIVPEYIYDSWSLSFLLVFLGLTLSGS
jgi:hypothetical protein